MVEKEGSPAAYRDLFFRYYSSFFAFARSLVEDRASAQQLTSEALSILWLKRADVTGEINCRAFLYNTIRNHALGYLKHVHLHPDAGAYVADSKLDPVLPAEIAQEIADHVAREM